MATHTELDERFTGQSLDPQVWFPFYLPHWSSREQSAATYVIRDGELHLLIPPHQPLWCSDLHDEPLRVSGVQTGSFAGPVGSTIGQQPFKEGLSVLPPPMGRVGRNRPRVTVRGPEFEALPPSA